MKDIWDMDIEELKEDIKNMENNKYEGITDDIFREYLRMFSYRINFDPTLQGPELYKDYNVNFKRKLELQMMRDKLVYEFYYPTYRRNTND